MEKKVRIKRKELIAKRNPGCIVIDDFHVVENFENDAVSDIIRSATAHSAARKIAGRFRVEMLKLLNDITAGNPSHERLIVRINELKSKYNHE
jgi:hypothetical protein